MKIRRELWFGFSLMALILGAVIIFTPWSHLTDAHLSRDDLGVLGLLMLALVVVAIMLGFPTAFTLMGMGMLFTWLAYDFDTGKTLTLMVQSAFKVMGNDVLISIPLFVFMGYLVERANLIDKLFKSLHLALARVPGSLAVATLFTCAIFATATGIVGAVVTLMGLLAFPQMLKGGYNLGGEPSGHIIMSDFTTTGDGFVAALQVLSVVKKLGRPVSEVCHRFEPLPQILKNVRYAAGKPLDNPKVQTAISDAEKRLNGSGRLLVRSSGTEPVIRVMGEGDDRILVEEAVDIVVSALGLAAAA